MQLTFGRFRKERKRERERREERIDWKILISADEERKEPSNSLKVCG